MVIGEGQYKDLEVLEPMLRTDWNPTCVGVPLSLHAPGNSIVLNVVQFVLSIITLCFVCLK